MKARHPAIILAILATIILGFAEPIVALADTPDDNIDVMPVEPVPGDYPYPGQNYLVTVTLSPPIQVVNVDTRLAWSILSANFKTCSHDESLVEDAARDWYENLKSELAPLNWNGSEDSISRFEEEFRRIANSISGNHPSVCPLRLQTTVRKPLFRLFVGGVTTQY